MHQFALVGAHALRQLCQVGLACSSHPAGRGFRAQPEGKAPTHVSGGTTSPPPAALTVRQGAPVAFSAATAALGVATAKEAQRCRKDQLRGAPKAAAVPAQRGSEAAAAATARSTQTRARNARATEKTKGRARKPKKCGFRPRKELFWPESRTGLAPQERLRRTSPESSSQHRGWEACRSTSRAGPAALANQSS